MPRMTIGVRLTVLYALPLLAVIAVGALSLHRLSALRRSLDAAAEENAAAMQFAAAGLAHASETSRLVHEALLETDTRRTVQILESVEMNRERAHKVDDSIRSILTTAEGRAAFRSVEGACDEFGHSFGRFKTLLVAGERDEAAHLLTGEILPQRRRVQGAWEEFIALHRRQIQRAAAAAAGEDSRAHREIFAAILVAIGACIAAGIVGTASVVRPVSSAVRIAQQIARGDLREKVIVDRDDELGRLQTAMGGMSDRLENVLAQVRRGAHEVSSASEDIRGNSRWMLEHTSIQSSAASEMAATLHQMSSASARALDVTRDLRMLLDGDAAEVPPGAGERRDDHRTVLRLALPCANPPSAKFLLDCADMTINELWAGVARVNRVVLSVDAIARDNSMKAQDLWCTAEALSRRAVALERAVEFFRVRELAPAEPMSLPEADTHSAL